MPKLKEEHLVIINPNAGKGLGRKHWKEIASLLENKGIVYRHTFTQKKHDAIALARHGIESGYRKIIAVGGDGTMNEVVNGCFLQKACKSTEIKLAMITVGTGNDWGRMFEIPTNYKAAIDVIELENTIIQDAGEVYYYNGTKHEKRFFINIAGLGFDAMVVKRTNLQKDRGRGGKALYFWNLLRSLMAYTYTSTEIDIDGTSFQNEVFTMSLGIGKYSGGGMMQTPNAIHDDGLFDITIIKRMRKGEIIRNLKLLYNGNILDHPKILGYTGKKILIDSDPLIHIEADGESLGHSPIEFNILPRSIQIVVPKINLIR